MKKTIVFEIRPDGEKEYVTVMAITRLWIISVLCEILIRVKNCYPFFVTVDRKEWKLYKNNLIELYKIKSKEYFEKAKEKVEEGELEVK